MESPFNTGELHPWYGPCDAFGPNDTCSECVGMVVSPGLGLGYWHGQLEEARERLSTLAANLAMAAGLELSYLRGHTVGVFRPNKDDHPDVKAAHRELWHPGCGKPAPGWGGEG